MGFYTLSLVCAVLIIRFGVLPAVNLPSETLRGMYVLSCAGEPSFILSLIYVLNQIQWQASLEGALASSFGRAPVTLLVLGAALPSASGSNVSATAD
jgi:hypothetical protein